MATDEELEQSYSALSNEQKTLHDFIVGGTEALIEYHSQVKEAELTNQPAPPQPDAAKQILHFQSGVGMSSNNFLWTTDMDEQHLLDHPLSDQRTSWCTREGASLDSDDVQHLLGRLFSV
jgi:hypothetical protein